MLKEKEMKVEKKKITELSERELSEIKTTHLADINKSLKSIKDNVSFIFWIFLLSLIASVFFVTS